MEKCGGPRECAKRLRHMWQMPTGPVRSVTAKIESAGGLVFRCPFGGIKVDGISQWPLDAPHLPPVFFVNEDSPGDRQRWTLCHEIGHVVMHHLPTEQPEEEANLFASEFLMPEDEIGPELSRMTLQKAAALKAYWKVSMQAIIRWAYELGRATKNQYQYLFKQLSYRGYRKCEPVLIPTEEPLMMKDILDAHHRHHGKPVSQLSDFIGETEANFRERYWHSLSGFRLVG
jgi:Zn-dependent peptidase ImmA (M78 family)